jgi:predicted metal-dependent hydrolase
VPSFSSLRSSRKKCCSPRSTILCTSAVSTSRLIDGEPTAVSVVVDQTWRGHNQVSSGPGWIAVRANPEGVPPEQSLENWLRRRARAEIEPMVARIARPLSCSPGTIYIRGQRTRWGSCSARGNLSFNWRLVMAPPNVRGYVIAHEVVHLLVPDHSQKFWLTLQGVWPGSERARQWLASNGHRLRIDLADSLVQAERPTVG